MPAPYLAFAEPLSQEAAPRTVRCSGKVLVLLSLLMGSGCAVLWYGSGGKQMTGLEPVNAVAWKPSMQNVRSGNALQRTSLASLPGSSHWKNLALAGIEAVNGRRDAHPMAAVLKSMDTASRSVVVNAAKGTVTRMEDLQAGQLSPMGFWDPAGLSANLDEGKILFYREAELKHGRVSMLASLGFLVGENFHPLFGGDIDVPSYIAFQATPLQVFWPAVLVVLTALEYPAIGTFKPPVNEDGTYIDKDSFAISADRVPGDLGFDPLGLKPTDPAAFLEMQNKELNNGRLAMISIAGFVAQELVSKEKILDFDGNMFR